MTQDKNYKCVNCGEPAAALFKTYGPSVLKLTKCDKCKGVVDKYIEYDPVIVMIDLVLMSKEAQRHVLYNTEFKSYWKLLITLMMLETYGVWSSNSLFNIVVNTLCGVQNNSTINSTIVELPFNWSIPEAWSDSSNCLAWAQDHTDDPDLFIWVKDFYIKFIATFAGIMAFILTTHTCMQLLKAVIKQSEVSPTRLLKAFSLYTASTVLSLPVVVWGADTSPGTRASHLALVAAYSAALATAVFTVLYECPMVITILVLTASNIAKYSTSFYIIPILGTLLLDFV